MLLLTGQTAMLHDMPRGPAQLLQESLTSYKTDYINNLAG